MADQRSKRQWTAVASFGHSSSAELARQRLEEEEIPCVVDNDSTGQYLNALGGIKIRVPDDYVEEARQVLAENVEGTPDEVETEDHAPELDDEHSFACPKCHSTDTTRFSWKLRIVQASAMLFLSGGLFVVHPTVAAVGLVLAAYFLMTKPDFRCTRCGHRWSL
jgi:hypothetical protein